MLEVYLFILSDAPNYVHPEEVAYVRARGRSVLVVFMDFGPESKLGKVLNCREKKPAHLEGDPGKPMVRLAPAQTQYNRGLHEVFLSHTCFQTFNRAAIFIFLFELIFNDIGPFKFFIFIVIALSVRNENL